MFLAGILIFQMTAPVRAQEKENAGSEALERTNPRTILLKMSVKARRTGYQGRKVIVDFSMSAPKITNYQVQRVQPGLERKDYPDRGSVVIQKDGWLWRYYPEEALVVKKRTPPSAGAWDALQEENLDLVMQSYTVDMKEGDEILGRPSMLVEFEPIEHGTRPSRKVWIDTENGVPLRTEVYGVDDNLYMLSHFQLIKYNSSFDAETFEIKAPGARVVESRQEVVDCQEGGDRGDLPVGASWRPNKLPSGFVLKCLRKLKFGEIEEYQHLYTDGLSSLSFFEGEKERKLSRKGGRRGHVLIGSSHGLIYDFGLLKLLKWEVDGKHLILIGELSPEGIVQVALSVDRIGQAKRGP
jgi:negative regulator of sigma E activity